ncbi:hypothetical protein VQ045_07160 [Aurantimonas sp. E1-2-R+4]
MIDPLGDVRIVRRGQRLKFKLVVHPHGPLLGQIGGTVSQQALGGMVVDAIDVSANEIDEWDLGLVGDISSHRIVTAVLERIEARIPFEVADRSPLLRLCQARCFEADLNEFFADLRDERQRHPSTVVPDVLSLQEAVGFGHVFHAPVYHVCDARAMSKC